MVPAAGIAQFAGKAPVRMCNVASSLGLIICWEAGGIFVWTGGLIDVVLFTVRTHSAFAKWKFSNGNFTLE
jgi:hypothetical protein